MHSARRNLVILCLREAQLWTHAFAMFFRCIELFSRSDKITAVEERDRFVHQRLSLSTRYHDLRADDLRMCSVYVWRR